MQTLFFIRPLSPVCTGICTKYKEAFLANNLVVLRKTQYFCY